MNSPPRKTSVWSLIAAWAWAGVPLAWGVLQTVYKASALFGDH